MIAGRQLAHKARSGEKRWHLPMPRDLNGRRMAINDLEQKSRYPEFVQGNPKAWHLPGHDLATSSALDQKRVIATVSGTR